MTRSVFILPMSVLAAAVLVLGVGASPASAAPSDGYASWTVAGSTAAFTGTLTLPAGFPATTVASTSQSFATSSGNSSWLPATSPAGLLVGSSRGKPYVSINPTSQSVPSVTTFTFATPVPAGVWGAAFGDIDAETIAVSATDATGAPVSAANLGVTSFNYCDAASNSCSAPTLPLVLPTLTTDATSVSAQDPLCPSSPANCNTQGGSIWVAPLVALSTLTVTSTHKLVGSPAAQMWFASVARTVAGVITLGTLPPVVVQLVEPDGDVIASTTTAADGSFVLPPVVPSADYVLRVDPAVAPDAPTIPIDVSTGDVAGVTINAAPDPLAEVTPVPTPAAVLATPPAPELAATGADIGPVAGIGIALLVAGAAAFVIAGVLRKRRSNSGD